jgi:hypothetical protein
MYENAMPIGIHCHLLALYGEDTVDISTVHYWIRKSSNSGRNQDLKLQSGRPVTATLILTGKKLTKLLKKINSKIYVKPLKRFKLNQSHSLGRKS